MENLYVKRLNDITETGVFYQGFFRQKTRFYIYYKRLNIKDIIYYSVEKEQETEKTTTEDQTDMIFEEERSSGA